MLELPKTTEFNKRIPKQKFYENISVTPALRRIFIDQIKVVYWRNKIAPSTMNLEAGNSVTEIEVFEVKARKLSIPSRAGSIIHAAVVQQEAFSLTMTKCFPSFMEPVILDCCIT